MTVYGSGAVSHQPRDWEVFFTPPAGRVFVSWPLPKKVDRKLALTGSFERNSADTRYQTLLELTTRPLDNCCFAWRERERENISGLRRAGPTD